MNDMSKLVMKNIAPPLQQCGKIIDQYFAPIKQLYESIEKLQPIFECIATLAAISKTAKKLSENQFVVVTPIPQEAVRNSEVMDADALAEKYLTEVERVNITVDACGVIGNCVFQQALDAFNNNLYNLAILGFTAVLDRILSECSELFKNVKIESRSKAIIQKVEEKGDIYLDELEGKDYLLFITYPMALKSFGEDSDFCSDEPDMLNRHWIMHGRTTKKYSRLDCVKVLNMIYGTIRMSELGKQDYQSTDTE